MRWAEYVSETCGVNDVVAFKQLRRLADQFYTEGELSSALLGRLPLTLAEFKNAVLEAEAAVVDRAAKKIMQLDADHRAYTLAQAKATELQKQVLQEEIKVLETQLMEWKPRCVPLTERLNGLYAAERGREAERQQLLAEWPKLESREKGEALRRLFTSVTLYWQQTFHPASPNPTRPRRTERTGRFSYTLKRDQIQWSVATTDMAGSW